MRRSLLRKSSRLAHHANYPTEKDKYTYNVGYLEIPLLFRYMLNRGGVIRPYLLFGPVYSGLLNAKFTGQTPIKKALTGFFYIRQ
jgi:hypothetical protein